MTRLALAVPVPAPSARLFTPREVADTMRVSPSMVRKLTRTGELVAVYIGRLPRYREADVSAYLERQRVRGSVR